MVEEKNTLSKIKGNKARIILAIFIVIFIIGMVIMIISGVVGVATDSKNKEAKKNATTGIWAGFGVSAISSVVAFVAGYKMSSQ